VGYIPRSYEYVDINVDIPKEYPQDAKAQKKGCLTLSREIKIKP
jgi:hypothetical protein